MNANPKRKFILVSVVSIAGFILFGHNLSAKDIFSGKEIEVKGAIAPIVEDCPLIKKIEEAKQLLSSSPPLQFKEKVQKNKKGMTIRKKGQPVAEITEKEISFGILDNKTCRVFEKRYWLKIAEINKAVDLRKRYLDNPGNLPMFRSDDLNEEFQIVNNWWNSFNSYWDISKNGAVDSRYAVIADKYMMANEDLAYPEDRTGEKYSDIIYVPYSDALKNKTLVELGKEFLNDQVAQAFKELAEAGVMSKAFPDRPVTETMTQAFVKNIFITEQTDPKMMITSIDGGRELVDRVFIRLGANSEKTFRYTVSRTGASGLGQIMPKTYANIFRSYSSAGLIKDTDTGRVNVKNGIKTSILVLDDHLAAVKNRAYAKGTKAKKIFDALPPEKLEEVRGMAYNGGPGKYLASTGGLNTKSRGAKETFGFLQKLRMIRELNLFDQYAKIIKTAPQ